MFLHAGWLHLAGNLFYLWVFAPPLEQRLGPRRFLVFYVASGLVAAAIHVASDPGGFVPTLGASGAVAGLLGAYAADPRPGRLRLVWPPVHGPGVALLGLWVAFQLLNGFASYGEGTPGVASWAHLGGFLAGLAGAHWAGFRGRPASAPGS